MMIGITSILIFLLIFVRATGVVFASPIFGNLQIPTLVKIGLSFYLSVIIVESLPKTTLLAHGVLVNATTFVLLLLQEALVGIALGLIANFIFYAIQFAGALLDLQIGFSMVNLVNPGFSTPSTPLANLLYILFALFFLGVHGDYSVILAILQSYRYVPIGSAHFGGPVADVFLHATITLFLIAVEIAAPVMLAIFLTNIAFAVASRAVPQMNVFFVGLPITLFLGLGLVGVLMPAFVALMRELIYTMDQQLNQLLLALGSGSA
ncbi:flagellar biosynthetic protein FliR [Sulfoacidibacillus thermotolerans]|uniref:Flagellar biosynthetic protein FliR n=1 Tax=Sulfoacidibacillus thermotolerans TaxID=1765684 RepID=A0A2U3DAA0_SULT2|nr:flagellar biosynthetic protein FliR [Sulfoacidibacillus thermotolerans]PWI58201.1 flagellar biosynthetic protein FliR [Sulfoacidibacillus thermotolerans]